MAGCGTMKLVAGTVGSRGLTERGSGNELGQDAMEPCGYSIAIGET